MTTKQLPAAISSLIANLEQAQAQSPAVMDNDFLFLKLTKFGEWVFGGEDTEVSNESIFAIDPSSYMHGWIAWHDFKLQGEEMSVQGQPPIDKASLPTVEGNNWVPQVGFALKGMEGPEEGVQLLYKTSSRGGKEAVAGLLSAIVARGKSGETDLCPEIVLEKSSYVHKKHGKTFVPVLTIDGWIDIPNGTEPQTAPEPVAAIEEPTPEPALEPTARKRKRRSA